MARLLADAYIDFQSSHHRIGPAPDEILLYYLVAAGAFEGPELALTVVPNCGAEWATVRGDGVITFESKQILDAPNGDLVCASICGLYDVGDDGYVDVLDDALNARVRAKFSVRFYTSSTEYRWLSRELFIGEGERDFALHTFRFQIFAASTK